MSIIPVIAAQTVLSASMSRRRVGGGGTPPPDSDWDNPGIILLVMMIVMFGGLLGVGMWTVRDMQTEQVAEWTEEYEFIRISSPPKHVYADFRRVKTGEVLTGVYVSKHFNEWRSLKPGVRITVTRTEWRYKNGKRPNFVTTSGVYSGLHQTLK